MASREDLVRAALAQFAAPAPGPQSQVQRAALAAFVGGGAGAGPAETPQSPLVLTTVDGRQQRRFARVDDSRELALSSVRSAADELGKSLKASEQGGRSYLAETYGRGNVFVAPATGAIYVIPESERAKPPSEQVPVLWNRPGVSAADALSIPAAVGVGALGAAAAAATGGASVPVQAAALFGAGAAGSAAQQALSAALPGDDAMSLGDRAIHAGVGGAFEAALPGAGRAAKWTAQQTGRLARGAVSVVREGPVSTAVQQVLARTTRPEVMAQRAAAAERLGVSQVPAAVLSDSDVGTKIMWWAAQMPTGAQILQDALGGVRDGLQAASRRVLEDVRGGAQSTGSRAVEALVRAHTAVRSSLRQQRSAAAKPYYERARRVAGKATAEAPETARALERWLDELDSAGPLTSDQAKAHTFLSRDIRDKIFVASGPAGPGGTKSPDQVRLRAFLAARRTVHDMLAGKRGVIEGIDDPGIIQVVGRDLHAAITADLAAMGRDKGVVGRATKALRRADDEWRKGSEALEALFDAQLTRRITRRQLLERVDRATVRDLATRPEELRALVSQADRLHDWLSRHAAVLRREAGENGADALAEIEALVEVNPADLIRAEWLEGILRPARGAEEGLTPARLRQTLGLRETQDVMGALFGAKRFRGVRQTLEDLRTVATAVADRGGLGGSQTAPLQEIGRLVTSPTTAATTSGVLGMALGPGAVAGALAGFVSARAMPRLIARAMLDPEMSIKVTKLSATLRRGLRAPPQSKGRRAATRLAQQLLADLVTWGERRATQDALMTVERFGVAPSEESQ